jgi:lipid-binding SYLF domain-containing protein
MKPQTKYSMCILVSVLIFGGCSVTPESPQGKRVLSAEVDQAIAVMRAKDPGIRRFFEKSYGYAVLPKVFKGAFVAGGAHGQGEVFEPGRMIGYCSMSQATLGFSFGGEFFREIVFFRDKEAMDKFKAGPYTFSAQVTGVALTAGAAASTDYKGGMAVFVTADSGLMVDVSLGGQKFLYVPKGLGG